MKTRLTSSEKKVLKNAFYNASGNCSGKILNILWQELSSTAKEEIEEILYSGVTIELPVALTKEEVEKLMILIDDMTMT